jgi:hypothetical protein
MKTGRNDPCPCGSGRKYKNCHLRDAAVVDAEEALWRRLHQISLGFPTDMLRFARARYGDGVLDEAWQEFTAAREHSFDRESIQVPLFMPWFFFEWRPPHAATPSPNGIDADTRVVSQYLTARGRYEDALTVRYLQACRDSVFSFYDVLEARPESGFDLRDALTGQEIRVTEKTASTTVRRGSILFARIATVDGLSVLEGCAPIALPPLERRELIDLRGRMARRGSPITIDKVRERAAELLRIYHSIAERLLNPTPPTMCNTDGDLIEFCRVTYEIASARAAFDALRHLSLGHSEADLLQDATFDAVGDLASVEIPWQRDSGDDDTLPLTSLGLIKIEPLRLVAEVNSQARATRFRAIADRELPAGSRYLSTVVEPLDAALAAYRREHPEPETNQLDDLPEMRELKGQYMRDHYRRWLDMSLPVLDGRTPREAVRSADGREMVDALLLDLEQRSGGDSGVDAELVAELRGTLFRATAGGRRSRGSPPRRVGS